MNYDYWVVLSLGRSINAGKQSEFRSKTPYSPVRADSMGKIWETAPGTQISKGHLIFYVRINEKMSIVDFETMLSIEHSRQDYLVCGRSAEKITGEYDFIKRPVFDEIEPFLLDVYMDKGDNPAETVRPYEGINAYLSGYGEPVLI